jgi:hypothetical protein
MNDFKRQLSGIWWRVRREAGSASEAFMILLPLGVLVGLGMFFAGGPRELAVAAEAFLQKAAAAVFGWIRVLLA